MTDEIITGTVISYKSTADNCLRITVEFDETNVQAAKQLLAEPGALVAVARLQVNN